MKSSDTASKTKKSTNDQKANPAAGARKPVQRAKAPAAGSAASERLMKLAWGYAPVLIIDAALSHGVFDALSKSPLSLENLVARTGASARGLRAILNALVGLELIEKKGERYGLTDESAAFLVSHKPEFYGGIFRHHVDDVLPRWQKLREAVRTGRGVEQGGQRETQERFARFVGSLFVSSYRPAQELGRHLGIPRAKSPLSVLDLGAGSGVWGIALAEQSPWVRVRAVDWPVVLEVTRKVAAQHGVDGRLETVAGNLLEVDFGTGHHVATIGHVLHSEGAERSRALLKKTFAALRPGGTVAISEFVPNEERTGPPNALIFAVNMLVHNDTGDVFTLSEISAWLREAGFGKIRCLEAHAASPLILATRS